MRQLLGEDRRRGTDLLIKMRAGVTSPKHLVSIYNIKELRSIDYGDRHGLVIGDAARITDVGQHPDVRKHYPRLTYACAQISS